MVYTKPTCPRGSDKMTLVYRNACLKRALTGLILSAALLLIAVPVKAATFDKSDSSGAAQPKVIFPPGLRAVAPGDVAIPTGGQVVFFTPQDENTSCTVLFLVNITKTDQVVQLTTFQLDGTVFLNTHIPVPAKKLVRVVSDTVSTVSASWQDAIVVNFTTFSAYARLVLPVGTIVEGYVAWNGSGGVYDPLAAVPTLPLRFWTKPVN